MEYIDKDKSYDGLVIYTDGYAAVPTAPVNKRTRVLWLFNNESNYKKMKDSLKHIGKSAFIKES
jgi:predicted metal-dependent peptidase